MTTPIELPPLPPYPFKKFQNHPGRLVERFALEEWAKAYARAAQRLALEAVAVWFEDHYKGGANEEAYKCAAAIREIAGRIEK